MSVTTFGPLRRVDGPLPRPRSSTIVDVATIVEDLDEHYLAGATVHSYPTETPSAWDSCAGGTFVKADGDAIPLPTFAPFTVYLPETCTSRSVASPSVEEFAARAVAVFAATEPFGIEREISQGIEIPLNPRFSDTNATVLASGAAVGRLEALALLEDAIGDTARAGVIHADPATVTAWAFDGPSLYVDRQGVRRTVGNDTPVVVGAGYKGAKPANNPGAVSADQAWAFATGPFHIRRNEIRLLPDAEQIIWALERTMNNVTYRAERDVLATWDTALQAPVLVDRSM